ncbi:MAG: hypothetical protein IJ110_01505 [Lachnospiraceae bacterium]|nr:hypothetical protein [Lachnospiraceae bacterium]
MNEEKAGVVERTAEKFVGLPAEQKSMAVMVMTAYETGRMDERSAQERQQAAAAGGNEDDQDQA